MVLESTYICVDSSEYQRNGDYTPTRLAAEIDAVNLVSSVKLRSNPENMVGIIAMEKKVDTLVCLTQDTGKILTKLNGLKPSGYCEFLTAVQIGNLALKHRPNKTSKPRIVLFVGSPISDTLEEMTKVAKKLRKEKVTVDAVAYGETGVGEEDGNEAKLRNFIDILNGESGTANHLVVVSPGTSLTEALGQSAVCRGEDGSGPPVGIGLGGDFDPTDDPELAMALRVSLEEQRARQEGAGAVGEETGGGQASSPPDPPAPSSRDVPLEAMTEEEQLAYALRMSMEEESAASGSGTKKEEAEAMDTGDDLANLIADPNALSELVSNLPGVNADSVAAAINVAKPKTDNDKDKKDEKKDKKEEKKEDGEGGSSK